MAVGSCWVLRHAAYRFEEYEIEGYQDVKIKPLVLRIPSLHIDHFLEITVSGVEDTKLVRIIPKKKCKDQIFFEIVFKHNITFRGNAKFKLHIDPEKNVAEVGPVSGNIVDLHSVFIAPIQVIERNGQEYYDVGKEHLIRIILMNLPILDNDSMMVLLSDDATSSVLDKIDKNLYEYCYALLRKIVEGFAPKFFAENRKFFKNVPKSEFVHEED